MSNLSRSIVGLCALAVLSGCAGMDRYLDEHRADHAGRTFPYTQVGRVEFYGPFDVSILQTNSAWPATPEDAKIIQESFAIVVAQPVAVNGTLTYPAILQTKRTARIAHHVRGLADREPAPAWNGPVIHESTRVPWSGDEQARYDDQWRYEKNYQRTHDDRPEGRTPADAPTEGAKP